MIIKENVKSSVMEFKNLHVDKDTVYVNKNESKWLDDDTNEHIGWIFGIQEIWDKDNFIEHITKRNEELEIELIEVNMELINTISFMSQQNEISQAELMMEMATLIGQIQGGE